MGLAQKGVAQRDVAQRDVARKILRRLAMALFLGLFAFLYIGLQGAALMGAWPVGVEGSHSIALIRPTAEAILRPTAAELPIAGNVVLAETPNGLHIEVNVENLSPGLYAFHIHEKGDCGNGGNAAGGHFNPNHVKHGLLTVDGIDNAHAGDLGNIAIGSDGTGTLSQTIDHLTLTSGEYTVKNLAVILHEKPDDFGQPTGNAGGRIACGVIQ